MSTQRVSRRELLRGLGLTAAGAALAACQPKEVIKTVTVEVPVEQIVEVPVEQTVVVEKETIVEAPGAEPLVLRWWSYYTTTDRCLMCGNMAKEFEANNPGITIEMGHGLADYHTKLATAFSAGDPPDLAGTTHTTMLVQIADGAILPLDDWYIDSGLKDKMHPAAIAWATDQGQLWCADGWDLFAQEWYYNKAVFEQAGVAEPKTKADLFQACKDLAGVVEYPFLFAGMSTWLWPELMSLIQAQTTGITLINQGTEAKDYNIPELKEAVELFGEMWTNIVPDASLGIEANDAITTFANGEVGIISYHTAWLAGIKANVSQAGKVILGNFSDPVLFVDEPKSPWPAGYGTCFVVPKQNQHLTETFALMSHIWSPETQGAIAGAGLGIPALPETWEKITDPLYQTAIKHIGESTPEALFWVDFVHPRVIEALYTGLLGLVQGSGTSDDVLAAMTEAIQST